jgi:hypothetical protein
MNYQQRPSLLPAHELGPAERKRLGVTRGPGRPRKIALPPSDGSYNAAVAQQRLVHVESDPLVAKGSDEAETLSILRHVAVGVAVESAAILWERRQANLGDQDAAKLCSRRVDALVKLARVVLEIHNRRDDEIRPELLEVVRESFLDVGREAAAETLGSAAPSFIKKLEAAIDS